MPPKKSRNSGRKRLQGGWADSKDENDDAARRYHRHKMRLSRGQAEDTPEKKPRPGPASSVGSVGRPPLYDQKMSSPEQNKKHAFFHG